MADLRHDGVAVRLGGRDWVVPPLNLRQLKRLTPKFAILGAVRAGMSDEQIDALIEVSHAALSRNYPDLTLGEVAEIVDLGNAGRLVRAIVGVSGLAPERPSEGGVEPGEGSAGSVSTGTS